MATRQQILTAVAHKTLLENPQMYANITNVQALRKEQARRWAQRVIGLNDPGAGAVEQAFANAGEISDVLPKLLDGKAKALEPIQKKAEQALKSRIEMDDALARILIANIGAEGQTKAQFMGASSGISTTALAESGKNLELKGKFTEDAIGFAASKDPADVRRLDEQFGAVLAETKAGGSAATSKATQMVRGMTPAEQVGLLHRAIQTQDPDVHDNVVGLLDQAGKLDGALAYAAAKAAGDKGLQDKASALGTDLLLSGPDGATQVDRMQAELRKGIVVTNPRRGAQLKATREALGDEKVIGQLDRAIAGVVTPEEAKVLRDYDEAIEKAKAEKDLVSPMEMRAQIRTSEGYVGAAQEALEKAGIEDSGRLLGLGVAARRAARQQTRGIVKEAEGDGKDTKVVAKRLALTAAQARERRIRAGGWADAKAPDGDPPDDVGEASKAGEDGGGGVSTRTAPLPELDEEGLEEAPDPAPAPSSAPAAPTTAEKKNEASTASWEASRAARRTGASSALRSLLDKKRASGASPAEEDEEEKVASARPQSRPADWWRSSVG